jgi:RHS repeat-associated protein
MTRPYSLKCSQVLISDKVRLSSSWFDFALRSRCLLLMIAIVLYICPLIAQAQSIQYTQNKPDQAMRSAMRVDPSTLGLSIEVPLSSYPARGGASLPINLSYSSKQWRIAFYQSYHNIYGSPRTESYPKFSEWAKAGWTTSADIPTIEWTGHNQVFNSDGVPYCIACDDNEWSDQLYINRIQVHMPGGASHELRTDDTVLTSLSYTGTYYAVDGSNLRYEADSSGEGTLYLPDGSRYLLMPSSTGYKYIDRNGNTLSYSVTNRQWTDTQGRVLDVPVPASPSATTYTYYLPSTTSTPLSYSVRWSTLSNALTNTSDSLRYVTNMTMGSGDSYSTRSPYLFSGTSTNRVYDSSGTFNPLVLAEIVLPNGQSYLFTYNVWGEITKVVYPTGGYERFDYAEVPGVSFLKAPYAQGNRGVIDRWLSPTGSSGDEVHWHYAASASSNVLTVSTTAPDNTYSQHLMSAETSEGNDAFGFAHVELGMSYEDRTYAPTGVGGAMLRRSLTGWTSSGPTSGGWGTATRNPRVIKQVSILFDTGTSDALTSTKTMSYDDDLNVTATNHYDFTSISQSSGQTSGIGSISAGALLRTEEATYLVNDTGIGSTTRTAYRNRNLLSLPTSTRVKNGSATVVAQTQTSYDETSSYPLLTYSGSISGWTDPSTNVRGLPTTSGVWLNTTNSYLQTHAQYDQLGNLRNTWDANGNQSQLTYSSTYGYAYPTGASTAVPDSTGVHGSSSSLSTSAVYNANTGLMTSLTDPNGQTTSYSYDSINRLSTITAPTGGATTTYDYGSTPGNLYMRTRSSIESSRVTDTYQFFDGLGRACRSFANEGSTYVTSDTQYDSMGRSWRVSNPYRTTSLSATVNPDGYWTTNGYDYLGRVTTVTTPDSAVVTSDYSGSTSTPLASVVTVTDQAGKLRRSLVDALGRLARVDEPDTSSSTGSLGTVASPTQATSYSYDTVGNLIGVTQGSQTRSFNYNSLNRLTSAVNPENGTVSYGYDNNGNLTSKTDPRTTSGSNWTTTVAYDALNRPITRTYTNDGAVTPPVNYYYDNASLPSGAPGSFNRGYASGRLVAMTYGSSSSNGDYNGYDEIGRVIRHVQQTDGVNYLTEATYYLNSAIETETYPAVPGASDRRTVSYSLDSAARLSSLSSSATSYAAAASLGSISYKPQGALESETLGNSLIHQMSYNTRLQTTAIKLGTSGNPTSVLDLSYAYGTTDNNGNVKSHVNTISSLAITDTFSYDSVNRISSTVETTTSGSGWTENNGYDRFGNRWIDLGGGSQNLTFSTTTNKITTSGYTYDAVGNLTSDGTTAYAYDAENHLLSLNSTSAYKYDGAGRRVRKLSGENTRFIYGISGELVAEYNGSSGNLQKEYVSGGGMMAVIDPSLGTRYTTTDHLGSPRVVTNSSGGVVSRHDYKAFGTEIGSTTSGRSTGIGYGISDGVREQFTGQQRDAESGLDYFNARYYSSVQGRFTGADPLSGNSNRPQSWNRFAYVLNNPLKLVDPSGMTAQRPSPEDSSADLHGSGGAGGMNSGYQSEWGQEPEVEALKTTASDSGAAASLTTETDPQNPIEGQKTWDACMDKHLSEEFPEGKPKPTGTAVGLARAGGLNDVGDSAMILALWAKESAFDLRPRNDHGPMQLTSWWSNYSNRVGLNLIVPGAYDSFARPAGSANRNRRFEGNIEANIMTGGNIIRHSRNALGQSYRQIGYGYGPGPDRATRTAYADHAARLQQRYANFLSCLNTGQ